MKFISISALFALLALQVAAGPTSVSSYDKPSPSEPPQVLWGQCGGYYYYGTTVCPPGAYCRYFSDWYSQCNPLNN